MLKCGVIGTPMMPGQVQGETGHGNWRAVPFAAGAIASGIDTPLVMVVLGAIAAYLLFWIALAALVGLLCWSSVANAATLAAVWLVPIVPTLANVAINRAVPVNQRRGDRAGSARERQSRLGHSARGDDASFLRGPSRMGELAAAWT